MTLATEPQDTPSSEPVAHATTLETWSHNERMRHIPSAAWMAQKLDVELRHRVDALFGVYLSAGHHADMEKEFRALCRSLDRVADVARHVRGNQHPPPDLGHRVSWSISHAVSNLNTLDAETFGRRFPFQTFERSNAEPLWAATLSVIEHVHRLTEIARTIDRAIDERMYEGLVTLQTPLDPRPMA
ncbi:MAG TPA: hypothetical protein VNA69_22275 [Thermoanaerobaculia bacterium]|nr:hypothetical protein [Thermoanaerobaculia bacterium]